MKFEKSSTSSVEVSANHKNDQKIAMKHTIPTKCTVNFSTPAKNVLLATQMISSIALEPHQIVLQAEEIPLKHTRKRVFELCCCSGYSLSYDDFYFKKEFSQKRVNFSSTHVRRTPKALKWLSQVFYLTNCQREVSRLKYDSVVHIPVMIAAWH